MRFVPFHHVLAFTFSAPASGNEPQLHNVKITVMSRVILSAVMVAVCAPRSTKNRTPNKFPLEMASDGWQCRGGCFFCAGRECSLAQASQHGRPITALAEAERTHETFTESQREGGTQAWSGMQWEQPHVRDHTRDALVVLHGAEVVDSKQILQNCLCCDQYCMKRNQ